MAAPATLTVRWLGQSDYEPTWHAMQDYTAARGPDSADELWLLEHPAVFTQGQAGKAEHLLAPGDIPVVQVDRGGQVTYHGPGQLVGYVLLDLKRLGIGVRALVTTIEESIVALLAEHGVSAAPRADAPGVYLENGAKIAQLGLRVRRGCSFHGLSLNLDMDLTVFQRINPCGHVGMAVTDLASTLGKPVDLTRIGERLVEIFREAFGYSACDHVYNAEFPCSSR
ncbi:lipoyl(octanoyl) transferase [Litorivivens lipolytica]|uniref:Octanoyltransferase n=1 Tax=Litorivivens lipolytica TaxID=1524264 RepID=A0A7W4W485_9GAMM|nr:lipoyl(octanoyl) transferase LipB [Litorivivens lipolytica]MBB3047181.1 lipoyl(octanoyl) transferase [Litorivivens lipolytica]